MDLDLEVIGVDLEEGGWLRRPGRISLSLCLGSCHGGQGDVKVIYQTRTRLLYYRVDQNNVRESMS